MSGLLQAVLHHCWRLRAWCVESCRETDWAPVEHDASHWTAMTGGDQPDPGFHMQRTMGGIMERRCASPEEVRERELSSDPWSLSCW